MSNLPTSPVTGNAISSPASVDGPLRFAALDGMTTAEFGRALAPANLSARQARALGLLTSGICGPYWFHLITTARPAPVPIVGEQVASRAGLAWLDLVCNDLEGARLAFRAFDLAAGGFEAAGIRQRLFWLADPYRERLETGEREAVERARRREKGRATIKRSSASVEWHACDDGTWRPAQPGVLPLAPRLPGDVGRLRAYGNAIHVGTATEFILASGLV